MQRASGFRKMFVTAAGTLGSRVFGLVRDQLVAGYFGTGALASALILAFQIPNLFRRLLGEGALTTALVPVMSDEFKRGGKPAAFHFLNVVLLRAALLMLAVSLVFIAGAWLLAKNPEWIAGAFSLFGKELPAAEIERYRDAASLTVVCMPYMPMICLAALFTAGLNLFGRFGITSFSAVWLNISMIAAVLVGALCWHARGYELALWVCAGSLVGGFFQLATPVFAFWREGWRPHFAPGATDSWHQLKLIFIPAVAGAGIQQINFFMTRFLAFNVDEQALAVYYFANRVVELPVGLFAITVSTVIFPAMALHASHSEKREMGESFAHGMRLIFALNIPAAFGLIVLSEPIIEVLFQHGKFNAGDVSATLPVLWIFAVSMPFYGLAALIGRGFSSIKDTRTQSRMALWVFLVNCVLSPVLGWLFKAPGLAGANLVAAVFQCVILLKILRKKESAFAGESLRKPFWQCFAASVVMGAFAFGGWLLFKHFIAGASWFVGAIEASGFTAFKKNNPVGFIAGIAGLLVIIPPAVAFYFFILGKMRYSEYDFLVGKILGKLLRRKR